MTPTDPVPGKGIRLFVGDAFLLTRKYGVSVAALQAAITGNDIELTITGTGSLEKGNGDPFVRMHFKCPHGVFISTERQEESEPVDSRITPAHRSLVITRRDGEAFRIRPIAGKEEAAAHGLQHSPIFIEAWESVQEGAKIRISAPEYWQIVRTEIDGKRTTPRVPPTKASLAVSAAAFQFAAEKLLPSDQLNEIRTVAAEYMRRPASEWSSLDETERR